MERLRLTEDFSDGTFKDPRGNRFIISEFDPDNPVPIEIRGQIWSATYQGRNVVVNWGEFVDVPDDVKALFMNFCKARLRVQAPFFFLNFFRMAKNIFDSVIKLNISWVNGFSNLRAPELLSVWDMLDSNSRSHFRSFYTDLARNRKGGASFEIAQEMRTWKARDNIVHLRDVVYWNPNTGAFTAAEWDLVRRELESESAFEDDKTVATKIFGRILAETLKRPSQILSIKAEDGLVVIPSEKKGLPSEYFLKIPRAKAQVGAKAGMWQITEALGKAILAYSKLPRIQTLQQTHNRLVVLPNKSGGDPAWVDHGQVPVQIAKCILQRLFITRKLISPRTGKVLNVTPNRIRHTGATALALQGFSRDDIQEVLEHDSPFSADAYIEAVGSDLMPALEKATDRGLGKVFSMLADCYFFRGQIVDKPEGKPIFIPAVGAGNPNGPAVVGSCGKAGSCTKHPFWACYNGCEHFLAWRDADHMQSLEYVKSELDRWSKAEGGQKRSKLYKDFDRIAASIQDVIQLTSHEDGSDE